MMRRLSILGCCFALLNCSCTTNSVKESAHYDSVSVQSQKSYVLVDVRSEDEFSKGFIVDAINVPVDKVSKILPTMYPDKQTNIYFYCSVGGRAVIATNQMKKLGYYNVRSLGSMRDAKKFLEIK